MKKDKTNVCPQIGYHITYEENLTFKDLEELLHLIRISNNDALREMGVPRHQANELQRIEKIEPGSIEIILEKIMEIIEAVDDAATVISAIEFAQRSVKSIFDTIRRRRERPAKNPREDRKVYDKHEVIGEVEERPSDSRENCIIYVIHIHICN